MSDIFDSLEPDVRYHVSIAARVAVQDILKAAAKKDLDFWCENLVACRSWLEKPPVWQDLEVSMVSILTALSSLDIEDIEALAALMEGRCFDADSDTLLILHEICPFSLEPDGERRLKATLPAEFIEAWADDPNSGTSDLPTRFRMVDPVVDLLNALASLYGAISLDEALGILRSFGALDGLSGDKWLGDTKIRLHALTDYSTRISDGILSIDMEEGDAKWLLRETKTLPRWIPPSKEALLAWVANGYLDDTPATAALTSWAFEHASNPGSVNAIVAGASARVRSCFLKITEDIPLFAGDGEWEDEDDGGASNLYARNCRALGLFDSDLPPGLRQQFMDEQRRWILKGATAAEFKAWLPTPEGMAWQKARRDEAAKRARDRKSGKKKHRRH